MSAATSPPSLPDQLSAHVLLRCICPVVALHGFTGNVAVHEARHLVAGLTLGIRLRGAELSTDVPGQAGRAVLDYTIADRPTPIPTDELDTPVMRRAALRLAIMYVGGLIAEMIHAGMDFNPYRVYAHLRAEQDYRNAERLLRMTWRAAPLAYAQQVAHDLLLANWDTVSLFAAELDRCGRLMMPPVEKLEAAQAYCHP